MNGKFGDLVSYEEKDGVAFVRDQESWEFSNNQNKQYPSWQQVVIKI